MGRSKIVRFSVSVERELFEEFDRYCREEQFATRSEAVRQMIRDKLTERAWTDEGAEVAGTLTLVYDHHRTQLRDRLLSLQHEYHRWVLSVIHAHLTKQLCLEVILLRGPAGELRRLAAQLQGLKGIHKGQLVMATASSSPTE
ncbi:MAG: nickel-responsive transcriptional regulator NikR [Thermoguttaceae bacterium]|nr:nickel-responsive transcriptional regulator NikR [Thermoguttaceae bacterium]MDW8037765.1 nickel-responsive transcriptional regulator NikR [Thermoguttaceae bacterium]